MLKFYRRGYRIGLRDLAFVCARLVGDESKVDELHAYLAEVDRGSDVAEAAVLEDS